MQITDYIRHGKDNAIHLQDLSAELGCSPETIKAEIRKARRDGALILSASCGYWLAESPEEMQKYIEMMRRQAISRLFTIKPIKTALNQIDGQINVSDVLTESAEVSHG